MQQDKLWHLRRMDIFSGLSDADYGIIDRDSTTLLLNRRQLLSYRGTARRAVYFVKKGRLKLVRTTPDGHEVIIDILGPSTLFGELERGDDAGEVTAEALEETLLCIMRRDNFDRLMAAVPTLGMRIIKLTGLRLRKIQNRLVDMLYAPVEVRLATTLLGLTAEFGIVRPDGTLLDVRLTHSDFAALVASTRETVSAALNKLARRGVIAFQDHRILVPDRGQLARLAGHATDDEA
jgi:CRP-like cAMP-binding protein